MKSYKMRAIRIASRPSKLAVRQSQYIGSRLEQFSGDVEVSIVRISTRGDRDKSDFLYKGSTMGYFTGEVEKALLGGRADLALSSDERAIDERLKLVSSWEELLANPLLPLEPLVRQLAGKSGKDSSTPERKRRIKLLAEWQLAKARTALGQSRPQGNGELDRLLATAAAARSPRRLVHDSLTMNSCTLALGRNANAKLAIREALLHIRG